MWLWLRLWLPVQGPDYAASVRRLPAQLPALLFDIQVALRHPLLQQAAEYYAQFTAFVRGVCGGQRKGGAPAASAACLPTIASMTSVPLTSLQSAPSDAAPAPAEATWEMVCEDGGTADVSVSLDGGDEGAWEISVDGSGLDSGGGGGTDDTVDRALALVPMQPLCDDVFELQAFLAQVGARVCTR